MIAKAQLIDALRLRYDHYSAEAVFDIARQRVEIEDKAEYSVKEAKSLRAAIELSGDRVGSALAAIDSLLDAAPAAAEKAEAPKQAKAEKTDKAQAAKPEPAKPEPAKPEKSDKTEAAKADKSDKTQVAKSDAKPQVVEVVLTGVLVADGEQVLMCGAFDELGDWDPEKARPLIKKGDAWLTTVKLQPDTKVAFKFLRRTADGKVTWESGDDRYLTAPRVEASWR
jgi:hypothetical protein